MFLVAVTTVMAQSEYKKIDLSKSRSAHSVFNEHYKPLDLPGDSIKPGSRFTLSTNLLEWAIVAPNIGLEYDLKDPQLMSSPSIYFQFTWRPGQSDLLGFGKEYAANNITFWRARFEYRWHFRFNERKEQRRGLAIPASWINEHWFTKSEETYVPDTAAIAAGDEYATMAVKSKQPAIDRKIDSTMVSTLRKKQNMFPGRWYAGFFGDVYGYDFNQKLDWLFFGSDTKGKNKIGNAAAAGLSAGYEFPGFNYNHKFFMQWSVGASIGGIFAFRNEVYELATKKQDGKTVEYSKKNEDLSGAKFIPMPISELRVALNFRNTTISKKYWQPDNSVYEKNIMQNRDDSIHMAELDSVLEQNPVVIQVHSVNGFDSTYTEVLDKMSIVRAFQQSTGLTYLLPQNFNVLPVTQDALNKKELSDNYFIEYTTTNRLRNYEDSVYVNDRKNLKFGIEIAGRAEADSLMQSFKDSLSKYYETNNTRPVFYGEPATKDSLKGFIPKDTIAAEFSRIWGHKLDTAMIRALYMNRTVMNDDGTTTNFLDSIIGDTAINRGSINYGMFIQFHPQVTISAEDFPVARFRVGMAGADDARALYNNVASYYNSLAKIGVPRIQRPWNFQNDSFPNRVTKEEVLALFQKQGLEGQFDMNKVSLNNDSIFTFNNLGGKPDTLTFDFGVTENPLSIPFVIEDSIGKANAQKLYQTLREWYATTYWQYLPDDDPIVPGYYNEEEDKWYVHTGTFIKVLSEIDPLKDVTFLPQQVDSAVQRVPRNSRTGLYQANRAGYYRAYAQVLFHREVRGRDGSPLTMRFPYQIKKMDSMEEAGFVEEELDENGNPYPKPEFVGPDFKKTELYDEMGKSYKCQVYTDSAGTQITVVKDKEGWKKVVIDEFGDVGSLEPLGQDVIDWITPKPFLRDEEGNLVPALQDENGHWYNPAMGAPKKVLKPEMIGPSFTTEEMYDEMGKSYKVSIYTLEDSAATKLRVLPEANTFRAVKLDEFGDFGGTEELSDSLVNWLTPKPFFRDSLGNLIPAMKDSLGQWIDPFAVAEEAQEAVEAAEEAVEETVDLESMTPKERKAYEKQKAAEAKAKAKAEAAAKKKAEAEAKAAAKKAAAEAKKNKGKKTVEAVPAVVDSLATNADSAFNNLSNTLQQIADSIPGVSAEVVNVPAADVLTEGAAAVTDSIAQIVEEVAAPVLSEKERKALEKKQAAEAKAKAKAEAAAAKKAAAEAKKKAAVEAKAAAAAKKKAAEEAKAAAKKVEEKTEEAAPAVENAVEQAAENAEEAGQSVADILTGGNAETESTPAESTETTTEE